MPHAPGNFFLLNIDFGPPGPFIHGHRGRSTSPECFSLFTPTIYLYQTAETASIEIESQYHYCNFIIIAITMAKVTIIIPIFRYIALAFGFSNLFFISYKYVCNLGLG